MSTSTSRSAGTSSVGSRQALPEASAAPVAELLRLFASPVMVVRCPFAEVLNPVLTTLITAAVRETPQGVLGKSETFDDLESWDSSATRALTPWVLDMAMRYVEACLGQPLSSAWEAESGLRGQAFNERDGGTGAKLVSRTAPTIAVGRSWASLYHRGDAHGQHFHPNTAVAAIYYAAFPPGSRGVVVHDPRSNLDYFNPGILLADEGLGLELSVAEGTLVLFPGWLRHSVPMHERDVPRIAVSYNLVYLQPPAES